MVTKIKISWFPVNVSVWRTNGICPILPDYQNNQQQILGCPSSVLVSVKKFVILNHVVIFVFSISSPSLGS